MDPSTAAELNRNEDFLSRSPSLAPETEGAENLVASPVPSPETHGIKLVLLILTNWDNKGLGVGDFDAAVDVLQLMIKLSITEAGHYGVLIENCCKAGQYDRGVKLLEKLIEKDIILRPQSTLYMEPSA
ncbi:hypothetical protein SASPL_107586 [Salvia splendens]|uniref:Uncharacterized protein n=1 Tax=Salvia splendens TaxID=180675 RepID=A0A8X8YDP9_SALSN|nr:hypothetical protein SASPL_107586 [Salvia splendens]